MRRNSAIQLIITTVLVVSCAVLLSCQIVSFKGGPLAHPTPNQLITYESLIAPAQDDPTAFTNLALHGWILEHDFNTGRLTVDSKKWHTIRRNVRLQITELVQRIQATANERVVWVHMVNLDETVEDVFIEPAPTPTGDRITRRRVVMS